MKTPEELGRWLRESGTVISRERYIRRWLYAERAASHEETPELYHQIENQAYGREWSYTVEDA